MKGLKRIIPILSHITEVPFLKIWDALMTIPRGYLSMKTLSYGGWIIVFIYGPSIDVTRGSPLSSLTNYGKIGLVELIKKYFPFFIFILAAIFVILLLSLILFNTNQRLRKRILEQEKLEEK